MYKQATILSVILLLNGLVVAQQPGKTDNTDVAEPETTTGFVFKPTIGLGVGMFTFYGDISKPHKVNLPNVSRIGYDLRITQSLTDWLDLSFYVLFGKLAANERTIDRNHNFDSKITTGGMALSYNFGQLLKKERIIDPYISVGFESFEFLSKTDLVDEFGNTYFYWSDGSIRNIDQNDPDSENAIRIHRDYTYESDIRELNIDGFGDYPERSWAVPAGVGANLYLNDKLQFRIGTAMHFAFTDYVDGITEQSVGNRKGDAANDHFLFTSFNLNYNLIGRKKKKGARKEDPYVDVDFLALNMDDADGDGVTDFEDACPDTPENIQVDDRGCPPDDDDDGVPNYRDNEPNTADTAAVDEFGVTIPDTLFEDAFLRYMDSTGMFATVNRTLHTDEQQVKPKRMIYKVQRGDYVEEIPLSLVSLYRNNPDVEVIEQGNVTLFVVKKEDDLTSTTVNNTTSTNNTGNNSETSSGSNSTTETTSSSNFGKVKFKVQVGAFSGSLPIYMLDKFIKLGNVSQKKMNGLTKYFVGSFDAYSGAQTLREKAIKEGIEGCFIVAEFNGELISAKKGRELLDN